MVQNSGEVKSYVFPHLQKLCLKDPIKLKAVVYMINT